MKSDYQNSGVMMEFYTGNDKDRYYGRIEEIWELSYTGEKVPMFRVRWAKMRPKRRPVFHHHGYTRSQIEDRGRKRHHKK